MITAVAFTSLDLEPVSYQNRRIPPMTSFSGEIYRICHELRVEIKFY